MTIIYINSQQFTGFRKRVSVRVHPLLLRNMPGRAQCGPGSISRLVSRDEVPKRRENSSHVHLLGVLVDLHSAVKRGTIYRLQTEEKYFLHCFKHQKWYYY